MQTLRTKCTTFKAYEGFLINKKILQFTEIKNPRLGSSALVANLKSLWCLKRFTKQPYVKKITFSKKLF